jgi:hypothetical protein
LQQKAIETGTLMAAHQGPAAAVGTDLPLHSIPSLDVASFIAAPVAATVPPFCWLRSMSRGQ